MTKKKTTDSIGYGAELLVRADLMLTGIITHTPDSAGTPYDIIADIDGTLRKIQVKARTADELGRVKVEIRKPNGEYRYYTSKDCDIIAVVEPNLRLIAYLPLEVWQGKTQVTVFTENIENLNGTKLKDKRSLFEDYRKLSA